MRPSPECASLSKGNHRFEAQTHHVHVRFLQVQQRRTERLDGDIFIDLPELRIDQQRWFSWDEAVEVERDHQVSLDELLDGRPGPWWPIRARTSRRSVTMAVRWPGGSSGAGGAYARMYPRDWSRWTGSTG